MLVNYNISLFRSCLLAIVMYLLPGSGAAFADQALKAGINDLKAAYIFNFIRFTDWPAAEAGQNINLKVRDADQLFAVLQTIAENPVAKRMALHVEVCSNDTCVRKVSALFIGKSSGDYKRLLTMLDGHPVLTISDIPDFAMHGGMIEIKYDAKKLTFIFNLHMVRHAGLYISAQLLQLGEIVGSEHE